MSHQIAKIIIRFGDQSKQGLAAGLPLLGWTLQELHRSVLLTLFLDSKSSSNRKIYFTDAFSQLLFRHLAASYASRFSTIAVFMGVICTILNVSLVASARDLVVAEAVRVDISKLGVVEHLGSSIVTKLLANNLCCVCIPTVVADDSVHSVAVCRPHITLVGRASSHKSNLVVASRGCVVPAS